MRESIASLEEMLVITRVSKTVMPVRVPTGQVPSDSVVVFATDSFADQAILSSCVHQLWAIKYGTTMRVDPTYNPSVGFETLPRPRSQSHLPAVGARLDNERREIMHRRSLGLTDLYNLVNDPCVDSDSDVIRMRDLQIEVDEAAMDAYGWSDIKLEHGFHTYRQMERFTVSALARVELFDRLLEENHLRAGILSERGMSDQESLFS